MKTYILGDMCAVYTFFDNIVRFALVPVHKEPEISEELLNKSEPLFQIAVRGHMYPRGYSMGHTMKNGQSTGLFTFHTQEQVDEEHRTSVKTVSKTDDGQYAVHTLTHHRGDRCLLSRVEYINNSDSQKTLEYISSFDIGAVNPFVCENEDLYLCRLRSLWSAEGLLTEESFYDLQMEPSWLKFGVRTERFGQVGSMPVRKFYPFIGIRDNISGVSWGASLAASSSWQLELTRRNETAAISGGLADYEFGHWFKHVEAGQSFKAPEAILTVSGDNIDIICQRLIDAQKRNIPETPDSERDLPVMFNEFCTTWGDPSEENIVKIIESLKGKGIKYFVIDAGWYRPENGDWGSQMGDWNPSPALYPNGITSIAQKIRDAGMVPGIWFEFESLTDSAQIAQNSDWLLKRNGIPLVLDHRMFLDMCNPEVIEYLRKKVIDFMLLNRFQYIKIDYNDTIGIGCDGNESLGEGLRRNIEAAKDFFRLIRSSIPDVIIEVCASGGHRLEPSFLSLANMGSFSDAHECVEGPLIAANMHRMIHPSQSQIWGVVHEKDSIKRLEYVLSAAFLGRFCLSGETDRLSPEQWECVNSAIELYKKSSCIIAEGQSVFFGERSRSMVRPCGWQAVARHTAEAAMITVHVFENGGADIAFKEDTLVGCDLISSFGGLDYIYDRSSGEIKIDGAPDFSALVLLLMKRK